MNNADHHGYRVFLHLAHIRAGQEALAQRLEPNSEADAIDDFRAMAEGLDKANWARAHRDWLGYETELFRLAAHVFHALEDHQRKMGAMTFHARSRWCWESLSQPGTAGSWPTRAQAIAQAESELKAGESFRVGRLAASPVHRYVPKTEWLVDHMRQRAQVEHGMPDLEWPQLDLQQHGELQVLLEGLLVAFLEREGLHPTFPSWVDFETHVVPGALDVERLA